MYEVAKDFVVSGVNIMRRKKAPLIHSAHLVDSNGDEEAAGEVKEKRWMEKEVTVGCVLEGGANEEGGGEDSAHLPHASMLPSLPHWSILPSPLPHTANLGPVQSGEAEQSNDEQTDDILLAEIAELRKTLMGAENAYQVSDFSVSMSHAVDTTHIPDTAILCAALDLFLGSYACPPSAAAATSKDAERTAATEDGGWVEGGRDRCARDTPSSDGSVFKPTTTGVHKR
jgi:hypothetical protein